MFAGFCPSSAFRSVCCDDADIGDAGIGDMAQMEASSYLLLLLVYVCA